MSWDFWHHSTYQVQRTIRTHFQGVRCDNFGRSCLLGQAEKNTFQVSAHICWGMNLFQIRTGGRDQSKQLVLIIPGGWPNFRQLSSKILRLVWYWVGWFLLMFTIGFLMGGVQGHPQSHVRIVSLRNPKFPSYPSCTFVRKPTTISYYQAKNCLPPKMNVYRFINGSWPMHRTKPLHPHHLVLELQPFDRFSRRSIRSMRQSKERDGKVQPETTWGISVCQL